MPEIANTTPGPEESKHAKYKEQINAIVTKYYAQNPTSSESKVQDILCMTGLATKEELQDKKSDLDRFLFTKKKADEKLQDNITHLGVDDIDQSLATLIERCNSNTSLKLGIPEFEMKQDAKLVRIGSFNYSGEGSSPESKIMMRDARLQDALSGEKLPAAAEIPDTHIAVMAGRVRGAIAMIDKSDYNDEEKKNKTQYCIALLQECAGQISTSEISSKRFAKLEKDFTRVLVDNLRGINAGDGPLTGKKLIKALGSARDFAMLNTSNDHAHIVTIHPDVTVSNLDGSTEKKNGYSFNAIADPIPQSLRQDYEQIKAYNKETKDGESQLPKWYTKKSQLEQSMIKGNVERYLSGKCVMSSQDRNAGGVVNYWAQVEGVLNQGTKNVAKSIMVTRGTPAARQGKVSDEERRIAQANMHHMSQLATEPKKMIFENVASNTLFKAAERNMHNTMAKAAESVKVNYNQDGINIWNTFGRANAFKNIVKNFQDFQMNICCKSSKDRTTLALMVGANKQLHEKTNQEEFLQSAIKAGHGERVAAGQGGTPGVHALKLADEVMRWTYGLGEIGKLYKSRVYKNSSLAQANKVKISDSFLEKVKKKLGFDNKYSKIDRGIKDSVSLSLLKTEQTKLTAQVEQTQEVERSGVDLVESMLYSRGVSQKGSIKPSPTGADVKPKNTTMER